MTKIKHIFKSFWNTYKFDSVLFMNFCKTLFLTMAIMAILSAIIYYNRMEQIRNEGYLSHIASVDQVVNTMETKIEEIKKVTVITAVDDDTRMCLSLGGMGVINDEEMYMRIRNKMSSYINIVNCIKSIVLYINDGTDNGMFLQNEYEKNLKKEDVWWFDTYRKNPDDTFFVIRDEYAPTSLCFASGITSQRRGVAAVLVNSEIMGQMALKNIKSDMNFYIVDNKNSIVFNSDNSRSRKKTDFSYITSQIESGNITDDSNFFISQEDCLIPGWRYVIVTSKESYYELTRGTRNMIFLLLGAFLLISIIISLGFAISLFKPISNLLNIIDDTNQMGNITDLKNNEIKYLAMRIISALNENKELKNVLVDILDEQRELQMTALSMQISPHFMNNTLNIFAFMSMERVGKNDNLTKMITQLTRLTNHILRDNDLLVKFGEEIKFLEIYVNFLKLRYDNFEIQWDIDEGAMNKNVPKLFMQPLIENAVYYGIASERENGIVSISVKENNNYIVVNVTDNGIGMTEEKVNRIMSSFDEKKFTGEHIGIKNVYKRLKLMYGERLKFNIKSEVQKYTTIEISIPEDDI